MRVHALSDIHVDYPDNLGWLRSLSNADYQEDILILAGDVSDDMDLLAESLESLLGKFRKLCFIPGNHELWVRGSGYDCSLTKFAAVQEMCQTLGVIVECHREDELSLVPLHSWYDYSFAEPDRHLRRAWRDYRACVWPEHLDGSAAINRHFLELNQAVLAETNKTLISYSHFLPRIDLMPERIPIHKRNVYPVLGSAALGRQVEQLQPHIHVYG
ncbi:MAG: metallophosphoesterase, partial [Gammaproteobacteria bacterium]|nr:metallophosphoesterase [Gammaproteobacteria bacterium]